MNNTLKEILIMLTMMIGLALALYGGLPIIKYVEEAGCRHRGIELNRPIEDIIKLCGGNHD